MFQSEKLMTISCHKMFRNVKDYCVHISSFYIQVKNITFYKKCFLYLAHNSHFVLNYLLTNDLFIQNVNLNLLGVNLRTGKQGVFPSAYAVDTEYTDFDPSTPKVKRERFLLGYLGSVETLWHKGTNVLCQAVKKIVASNHRPHQYILEISDQGLRMVDKSRRKVISTNAIILLFHTILFVNK